MFYFTPLWFAEINSMKVGRLPPVSLSTVTERTKEKRQLNKNPSLSEENLVKRLSDLIIFITK